MEIGITANWDFISGKNQTEESRITLESFDSVESYLQFIKEMGVTSIELKKVATAPNDNFVSDICKNLKKNDFSLTIHGDVSENHLDLDLYSTFPWLKAVVGVYNEKPLLIVVHPIEGTRRTQDEYHQLTVAKIKNMTDTVTRDNLKVKIALEINQFVTTLASPGFTYDGILKIVTEVNSEHLGICFDFGHTWSNIRRGFMGQTIPDQFLNRVIHTHIHDLSLEYKTHWPLTFNNVPVAEYIRLLTERSYQGVLNLELDCLRFKNSIGVKEAVGSSLIKLSHIIKNL
jgi:sugar phosphate isomerase/epimerase